MNLHQLRFTLFIAFSCFALSAAAQTTIISSELGSPRSDNKTAALLEKSDLAQPNAFGDYYSLAPLLGDNLAIYYWASSFNGPTVHLFDGALESGRMNKFGTSGGYFVVEEGVFDLGGGVERYFVEVSTVDSLGNPEPWVDSSWAGNGLRSWLLDVGTSNFGGNDPIRPGHIFLLQNSGMRVFNSLGSLLGDFSITDSSTLTTLSGYGEINNAGADIAGVDVSMIALYWDIKPYPPDLALTDVDAAKGTFAPGSSSSAILRIENVGEVNSGAYFVTLYASTDTNITSGDTSLGDYGGPALDVDGFIPLPIKFNFPSNISNGDYYIGGIITIESGDMAPGNNVDYDPVPITIGTGPDVQVRPLSLDFSAQAQAASIQAISEDGQFADYQLPRTFQQDLKSKVERDGKVRVIVGFDTPFQPEGRMSRARAKAQRAGIQSHGKQLIESMRGLDFKENARYTFIPFMALTVDQKALAHLMNSPLVTSVTEDSQSAPMMATSNQVIGSPLAWTEGFDGAGQTIAILDTGVDKTHPWFTTGGAKVVSEACYSSNEPGVTTSLCPGGVESLTGPGSGVNCVDLCDHGTHVAGTAAGNDGVGPDFGVARNADLIAIQVFSKVVGEAKTTANDSDVLSALQRVFDLRNTFDIAAVNLSVGGDVYDSQCNADFPDYKDAIDQLKSVGIATIAATGNDYERDKISKPGCISTAISVGNTTRNDEVSFDSNIYPEIHLLAPGTKINSSGPGGGTYVATGTSQAAPHVAGAWAVMKQRFPDASVDEILAHFQSTATLVDDNRNQGIETGMPRINLDLAIGEPRTSFGIFNTGPEALQVSSITPATSAPWISWSPLPPFDVLPNQMETIQVSIDYALAPSGVTQTRLLINSDDPDESPYPGGVMINVDVQSAPEPEFESTPPANSLIAFGNVFVLDSSPDELIRIDNLGDANLTIGCSLSGAGQDHFNIKTCPITINPASFANVIITCEPGSVGFKSASLDLTTNDADEGSVSFSLSCTGVLIPPPDAPTGVSASDATYTDKVRLTWVDVAGEDSYQVFRCGSTNTITCGQIATPAANTTSYDDTGASADGTVHYYRVKACSNANGCSAFSDADAGNRQVVIPPPDAPTGVSASDATYTDKVRLTWVDVAGEDSYQVFRCGSTNTITCGQIATPAANTTSYDDTGASADGTVHYYRVKACSDANGCSVFSDADAGNRQVVIPPLDAPTDVSATDATYTDKVRVTWADVTGEDSYQVFRCGSTNTITCSQIATPAANTTSYDDTGASADGTVHYYRVKACSDANGCSVFSDADAGNRQVVIPPLDAPTDVSATDATYTDKVRVTWADVTGEDSYQVFRCGSTNTITCSQIATPAANTTSYDDTGASADGTVHYYRVKACSDANGCSVFSDADAGNRLFGNPSLIFKDSFENQ